MEIIIAAAITTLGGLIIALIRENRRSHGVVESKLDTVILRVDSLAHRQDDFARRLDEALDR